MLKELFIHESVIFRTAWSYCKWEILYPGVEGMKVFYID
jgi:hypothetical protein